MTCMTPSALLGPYRADPGPRTTSIRSTSSLTRGMKFMALTRSEGTRAMRLSVRVSREPEKMLLKPRTTTMLFASPVWAKSTAGRSLTWSATVRAGLLRTSPPSTTETEAGASRIFSCRREAVTTSCPR